MASLDLFPAFACERPLDTPLFFYHVPKTAGTTVDAVLSALTATRQRAFRVIPRAVGMREREVPAGMFGDDRTLVYTGHCWFGLHRLVGRPVHLCTVLRDPVARVISEYLWISSSRGRKPSLEDCRHYVDNLALPNLATRLLAGESEIDWKSVDRAIDHLGQFALVGRTEDLSPFLSALLTTYGGPSVRTGRAKQRSDPLKAILREELGDDIALRNSYDRILYSFAETQLFGRAKAILADCRTPVRQRVLVDNPHGKTFVVTPEVGSEG